MLLSVSPLAKGSPDKHKSSMYVYTYMGTKTISITETAYERLKEYKRNDESFSDVVNRLTRGEEDRMAGFGSWADTELHETVAAYQEEYDQEFGDRQDALSRH